MKSWQIHTKKRSISVKLHQRRRSTNMQSNKKRKKWRRCSLRWRNFKISCRIARNPNINGEMQRKSGKIGSLLID
jgi:hypothetical protein